MSLRKIGIFRQIRRTEHIDSVCPPPVYDFRFWNADDVIRLANCYAYALRFVPQGAAAMPQPGDFSTGASVSTLFGLVVRDGLVPACSNDPPPVEGMYLTALFARNSLSHDCHIVRQDADGAWSHKWGDLAVRKHDCAARIITDPRAADFWIFRYFVGYFYLPNGGITQVVQARGPSVAGWPGPKQTILLR